MVIIPRFRAERRGSEKEPSDMDYFNYQRGELMVEDVPAAQLAEKHGTPLYVYSGRTILEHYRKIRDAFASEIPAPSSETTSSTHPGRCPRSTRVEIRTRTPAPPC